jgi:hypothetical protein
MTNSSLVADASRFIHAKGAYTPPAIIFQKPDAYALKSQSLCTCQDGAQTEIIQRMSSSQLIDNGDELTLFFDEDGIIIRRRIHG